MPPQKRRAMQRSPVRGIGKKRRTLTPKKTTPRLSAPNRAHIPTHTSTTDRQDHADGQPKSSEDVPWSPVADIAPDNPGECSIFYIYQSVNLPIQITSASDYFGSHVPHKLKLQIWEG